MMNFTKEYKEIEEERKAAQDHNNDLYLKGVYTSAQLYYANKEAYNRAVAKQHEIRKMEQAYYNR